MSTANLEPRSMILEEFTPLVGQDFLVDAAPAEIVIMLVEAYPLPANALAERPPFLLIFRSAADIILLSGTYAMKAAGKVAQFGPDLIHLSPTNAPPRDTSGGRFYQAVFN